MGKFKIPAIPHTTPKCIRFPDELIAEVEDVITERNCTFTAFVLESVRFCLADLKDEKK